jgi:prophage regulatory protein
VKCELWGSAEAADYLGISRQRLHDLTTRAHDFPEPVAVISAGRIYNADDIRAWAARHRPALAEEPESE